MDIDQSFSFPELLFAIRMVAMFGSSHRPPSFISNISTIYSSANGMPGMKDCLRLARGQLCGCLAKIMQVPYAKKKQREYNWLYGFSGIVGKKRAIPAELPGRSVFYRWLMILLHHKVKYSTKKFNIEDNLTILKFCGRHFEGDRI